jgi:hypothetical protein
MENVPDKVWNGYAKGAELRGAYVNQAASVAS